jgi:C-terminal processing protease CtpA/Prc
MDAVAIERLSGACRLWGAVGFLHPYLAYREIDWDAALVTAIPRIMEATSAADYRRALDDLLAVLGDPLTRTVAPSPADDTGMWAGGPDKSAVEQGDPHLRWIEESVAVLVARDFQAVEWQRQAPMLDQLCAAAAAASALVLDLRGASPGFCSLLTERLGAFLEQPVALPGERARLHSGYVPDGSTTSGGYYSAWIIGEGSVIAGRAASGHGIPLATIVSGCSPSMALAAALQAAGAAPLVAVGHLAEPGSAQRIALPGHLAALVRTSELLHANGTIGVVPDVVVAPPDAAVPYLASAPVVAALDALRRSVRPDAATRRSTLAVAVRQQARDYAELAEPSLEYRLLGLFRLWNVVHYFYPYHDLLDQPWDAVLGEFIPRIVAANDALAYHLAVAEAVTRLQDTHGRLQSPLLERYLGTHWPPLLVRAIAGESVITHVPARADGATEASPAIGDVVLAVDGEEIAARRQRLAHVMAASTPQALQWRVHQRLLHGAEGSEAVLTVRRSSGAVEAVRIARKGPAPLASSTPVFPVFTVSPEGVGYIDLTRLTIAQVDEAFEAIRATPALIFDLRGYPQGTAWHVAPRLTKQPVVAARFRRPQVSGLQLKGWYGFDQWTPPTDKWRYTGHVVVLINKEAISQAEHTCLFLEAATRVTFVGSATNGANGDVTRVALPGGIGVSFSGHDVRHADGRQLQRVGIQPDVAVYPTLAGLRAGRDEVLEAALALLSRSPD